MADEDFAVLTALFVATMLLMSPAPRAAAAAFWTSTLSAALSDTAVDETVPPEAWHARGGLMPM